MADHSLEQCDQTTASARPEGQLPSRPSPVLPTLSLATELDAHLPPRHVERALASGRLQRSESEE